METNSTISTQSRHQKQKAMMAPFKRFYERLWTGLDESERRKKEQSESSSILDSREPHNSLDRETRQENRIGVENDRDYVDTLGYYEEDLATIEDEICIPSPRFTSPQNADGATIIIEFENKNLDFDSDENDSIIKEVISIETEYIRPSALCCYCPGSLTRSPTRRRYSPKKKKKKNTGGNQVPQTRKNHKHKIGNRADMTSMLSDDEDKENGTEAGDGDVDENPTSLFDITSFTLEECEARFMQELESSQYEHYNLENSHWRKGFEFVRS